MICSMTGFGRCEVSEKERRFTVELRSVNNRFLDLNIRLPKRFAWVDARVRAALKPYMKRGKVDVFINYEDTSDVDTRVVFHRETAAQYVSYLKEIAQEFGGVMGTGEIPTALMATGIAALPEVMTLEENEIPEEELWETLQRAVDGAGEEFVAARQKEGEFLAQDMLEKLDEMAESVDFITERAPEILESYKTKLREKIRDIAEGIQFDEARIATEVTIYADKICVDEELVRLTSHIRQMRDVLKTGDDREGVGRKLDFLAQEMNREANTILSKSTDLEVADRGILLKTNIEKLREQIQNLE